MKKLKTDTIWSVLTVIVLQHIERITCYKWHYDRTSAIAVVYVGGWHKA